MIKLTMLGVGNGSTNLIYNTCFCIQNDKGNFLVDTGGSIELINRLEKAGIDYKSINNIFISHAHTDHLLGLLWYVRKLSGDGLWGKIKFNVYCNDVVHDAIIGVSELTMPKSVCRTIEENINFIILNDGDKYNINGVEYTFFDAQCAKVKQFGFEFIYEGKRIVFLGDETANPSIYPIIKDADYVFHEAFCLDSEEDIFRSHEKKHSTVTDVCKVMNELNVKNLILYHTEDTHKEERQKLYLEEGKKVFNGNLIVPNDLDIVEIN